MDSPSVHLFSRSDPFGNVLRGLHYAETPLGRSMRLKQETAAKRRSDGIDKRLNQENGAFERRTTEDVSLLVLGPRGSGKSALHKQFQMIYMPDVIKGDRIAWKQVIHSNVISNVAKLLRLVDEADPAPAVADTADYSPDPLSVMPGPSNPTQQLFHLRSRLQHIVQAHSAEAEHAVSYRPRWLTVRGHDLVVRPGWQKVFAPRPGIVQDNTSEPDSDEGPSTSRSRITKLSHLVLSHAEAIQAFWQHPTVQQIVRNSRPWIACGPGFFLSDIERIAAPNYLPTDGDILQAQLITQGVEETSVNVPSGPRMHRTVRLFDVSGVGGQRKKAWASFFTDANTIIYMIDLACFDEFVDDGSGTNKMEDALSQWRATCRVDELAHINLIVFLNKADLLQRKLESGVRIRQWIKSYGTRANTVPAAKEYFELHVRSIFESARTERMKKDGPKAADRQLYVRTTTMLQTAEAQKAILDAREIIFMKMLVTLL